MTFMDALGNCQISLGMVEPFVSWLATAGLEGFFAPSSFTRRFSPRTQTQTWEACAFAISYVAFRHTFCPTQPAAPSTATPYMPPNPLVPSPRPFPRRMSPLCEPMGLTALLRLV